MKADCLGEAERRNLCLAGSSVVAVADDVQSDAQMAQESTAEALGTAETIAAAVKRDTNSSFLSFPMMFLLLEQVIVKLYRT